MFVKLKDFYVKYFEYIFFLNLFLMIDFVLFSGFKWIVYIKFILIFIYEFCFYNDILMININIFIICNNIILFLIIINLMVGY